MNALVSLHLSKDEKITSYIQSNDRERYAVINLGANLHCCMFANADNLRALVAACESALQEMGEPLDEPTPEPSDGGSVYHEPFGAFSL